MTSPVKLPPIPTVLIDGKEMGQVWFRAHEVRAYAEQAVLEYLQSAVDICTDEGREWDSDSVVTCKNYAEHCAVRIRRLISTDEDPPC